MISKVSPPVLCGVVVVIASIIATVDAQCQRNSEKARAAIVALENDWLSSESDGPSLDRILAEDFVHPVPQGFFLNKKEHIDWSVKHPPPAGHKAKFEKLDVRVYGETAIANGIVEANDATGPKPHRTIFTDVFVYRDGRWQAVNAQENPIGTGR